MNKYIQDNDEIDKYFKIVVLEIIDSGYELKDILSVIHDGIYFPKNNPRCGIVIESKKKKELSKKKQAEIKSLFEERNFTLSEGFSISRFKSKTIKSLS